MLNRTNSVTAYCLVYVFLSLILMNYSVVSYSIDGTWTINPSYLKNSPSNQTTIVDFEKVIQQDNVTVGYQMTIFSCLTLQYTYEINDNDIFLNYNTTSTSIASYTCLNNQIGQIRSQLQKVFYFVIVADSLSLLDPAGNTLILMTKIKPNYQSLSGIWTSLTALNANIYTRLYLNGTDLYLCNGAAIVDYSIVNGSNNKISFSIVSAAGCSQNQVLTALYKSFYYRMQNQIIHLYDQSGVQLMTMQKLNILVDNQPLSDIFKTSNIQISVNSSNNTASNLNSSNSSGLFNSSNSINLSGVSNSSTSNNSSNLLNSTNSSGEFSLFNSTNLSKSSNSTESNNSLKINLVNSSSNTTSNSYLNESSFSLNTSSNSSKLNGSTVSNDNSSSLPVYNLASQLPATTVSQFQNKWFVQLIINNDGTIGDSTQYSKYFILILPTRIMIYGDCNVHYSVFNLTGNMLSNIKVESTTTTCPVSPLEAQNLKINLSKWYYVAVQGNTLRIWDKTMNEILQLNSI